ncbi:MAG: hypothetical protein HY873_08765 [Chloroflexi bacterium]|nr:hypothetical protein [Chloroflexota bacterium]
MGVLGFLRWIEVFDLIEEVVDDVGNSPKASLISSTSSVSSSLAPMASERSVLLSSASSSFWKYSSSESAPPPLLQAETLPVIATSRPTAAIVFIKVVFM